MTQTEPGVETVNEDNTASDTTEVFEAQWNDFGALPQIPEFNVALAEFIVQRAATETSFPEILRQEGGIRSYERFIKILASPFPTILQILGGLVSTMYEKEIVECIALATFLTDPEHTILGVDGVPEYADFDLKGWQDVPQKRGSCTR
jgi:hypothetical protein